MSKIKIYQKYITKYIKFSDKIIKKVLKMKKLKSLINKYSSYKMNKL